MTYGVVVVQDVPWPEWRRRALLADDLGYDTLWVWDHLVHRTLDAGDPLLDSFTLLGAAAAITTRIRLGTLVASPTLRHPFLLAKQAVAVDHISGGRFELGIGAAGVERDYLALGIEPWSKREQVVRFAETVELVRAVTGGATSYAGRHYRGEQLAIAPGRPLPLTLAAHGDRTLRLAARHADRWNTIAPREISRHDALRVAKERNDTLTRYAEEAGRDPASISRSVLMGSEHWPVRESVAALREAVEAFREAGFDDFVVMWPEHPAETRIGHGAADPHIVERFAETFR